MNVLKCCDSTILRGPISIGTVFMEIADESDAQFGGSQIPFLLLLFPCLFLLQSLPDALVWAPVLPL